MGLSQLRPGKSMTRAMQYLVTIMTVVETARGIDYVTGNSYHMGRVWADELSMPMIWGIACLVVATIAVWGLVRDQPRVIVNAAVGGSAVAFMFAIQIADMRMFAWPPEDIRIMASHLGTSAIWTLIAATIHYRLGVEKRKTEILEEADG